ncbi:MAG: hypothetical protein IPI55_13565 [Flavobacteriales bacterium]|nr:hypothetical protein [Flavobacteriales bacterium]
MSASISPVALVAALFTLVSCERPPSTSGTSTLLTADTLTFEGEYRGTDGKGRWMRCGDGHYFPITGPKADSLYRVYTAQVGHIGDAAKVWLRGAWTADSSVHLNTLLLLAPAMRCDPIPTSRGAGRYLVEIAGSAENKRSIRMDLFANGRASQYSVVGSAGEREESGMWGMDSDGRLIVEFPQRPMILTYALDGDSLRQLAPLPAGAVLVLHRTGPADAEYGLFAEVRNFILEQPTAVDPAGGAASVLPSTYLSTLLPNDTGLAALEAATRKRYGMEAELSQRRWPAIVTVHDLTELVRHTKQ